MSKENEAKTSIINYVENFIDKRDNELNATAGDDSEARVTRGVDRDSIVIKTGDDNYQSEQLVSILFLRYWQNFFSNNYSNILIKFIIHRLFFLGYSCIISD